MYPVARLLCVGTLEVATVSTVCKVQLLGQMYGFNASMCLNNIELSLRHSS